jgi:uncharacterized protein (DUF2384 family)
VCYTRAMTMVQILSASPPMDALEVGPRLARALIKVEAMGCLDVREPITHLDRPALTQLIESARKCGIGAQTGAELATTDDVLRLGQLLDQLTEELEDSPVPNHELSHLRKIFDSHSLAALLGTSERTLRRYETGERITPDPIAMRAHFLALTVGDLAGGYNDIGIRGWFRRPRKQLDGKTPAQVLQGDWNPDDRGPTLVRELASALTSLGAT